MFCFYAQASLQISYEFMLRGLYFFTPRNVLAFGELIRAYLV